LIAQPGGQPERKPAWKKNHTDESNGNHKGQKTSSPSSKLAYRYIQGDNQSYENNAGLRKDASPGKICPSPVKEPRTENKQKPHPQNKAREIIGHVIDQIDPEISQVNQYIHASSFLGILVC